MVQVPINHLEIHQYHYENIFQRFRYMNLFLYYFYQKIFYFKIYSLGLQVFHYQDKIMCFHDYYF